MLSCYTYLKNGHDDPQDVQPTLTFLYLAMHKSFMLTANKLNSKGSRKIQSRTFENFCENKYILWFKPKGARANYMLFHPIDDDILNRFKKMFDIGNEVNNYLLALHIFEK